MQVEAQSEWPPSIKESAQTYIYQIKALEQLIKVTTAAFRQSGLQKKYGTKRVFCHAPPKEEAGAYALTSRTGQESSQSGLALDLENEERRPEKFSSLDPFHKGNSGGGGGAPGARFNGGGRCAPILGPFRIRTGTLL